MSSNKRSIFREKVSKLMLREEESSKHQRIASSGSGTSENTLSNNVIGGI